MLKPQWHPSDRKPRHESQTLPWSHHFSFLPPVKTAPNPKRVLVPELKYAIATGWLISRALCGDLASGPAQGCASREIAGGVGLEVHHFGKLDTRLFGIKLSMPRSRPCP